jgi:hypothetical protein
MFNVYKFLFQGLGNVELFLELAIDSMNIHNNIHKSDGGKKSVPSLKCLVLSLILFLVIFFYLLTYISNSTKQHLFFFFL